MDGDPGVLVRVFSILGRDGVLLHGHGLSGVHVAVLEHHCRITKYEVHCSVNITFAEELALRVYV